MSKSRGLLAIPYPWVVVGLCVLATMASHSFIRGIGVLFPFIQDDLDLSRAQLGVVASMMTVGGGVTALLGGWLADVVGVRRWLTVGLAAMVLGIILFSQVQTLVQAILVGLLTGVAFVSTFPTAAKGIVDWVTPRTRGLALGGLEASIPVIGIIAAVLLAYLADTFSWRTAIMACAVMIAISAVIFFVFYRNRPRGHEDRKEGARQEGRIALIAGNRDIWLVAIAATGWSIGRIFGAYLVLFLKEDLGMSPVLGGVMLAVAMAGSVVGRVGWGVASDLLLRGRRVEILGFVNILGAVSVALLVWLPSNASVGLVAALVFFIGATGLGWSGLWTALLAESAGPDLVGTAIGFAITIHSVFGFVVAPLFGFIVDRTGSYDMGWWLVVAMSGGGTLLLPFLRPQERRP